MIVRQVTARYHHKIQGTARGSYWVPRAVLDNFLVRTMFTKYWVPPEVPICQRSMSGIGKHHAGQPLRP
jgi:hypothetical protein